MGGRRLPRSLWLVEAVLLGVGLSCLGYYGYASLEARRFQEEHQRRVDLARAPTAADGPDHAPVDAEAWGRGVVGRLEIPRLNIKTVVMSGESDEVLDVAIGHLLDTPAPWEPGNSVFAGHRDGLFRPLKDIRLGDEVLVRSPHGDFSYRVSATRIVEPTDLSVIARTPSDTLTLITCYPFYYVGAAPNRFIVHAQRVERTTKN